MFYITNHYTVLSITQNNYSLDLNDKNGSTSGFLLDMSLSQNWIQLR